MAKAVTIKVSKTRSSIAVPVSSRKSPRKAAQAVEQAEMFFNREWSWIDFNSRVLAQVAAPNVPLLESVKFLSIFSTNLDEFFMVRVAGLKEQLRTRTRDTGPDRVSPEEQLAGISHKVRELVMLQSRLWLKDLAPRLEAEDVRLVYRNELSPAELKYLNKYFEQQIFPVLTPMGVDPSHPFPHLPNRSLSLCTLLKNRNTENGKKPVYAFVEVPQVLPRFIPLGKKTKRNRFVLLDEVIALNLPRLFVGHEVIDSFPIRVTRDSDLEIDEEEAEDLLKIVEAELRQRRWGNAVRLEISSKAPEYVRRYLRDSLKLEDQDIFAIEGPLNFGDFILLPRLADVPHLKYPPFTPHLRPQWQQGSPFELISKSDVLAHHPYESFTCVADFVEHAAIDPQVLALKITLYRTSPESPIMRSLMKAANNGKQVVALVELKARFDEANNIQWARVLEREGVHVVYGIVGLKTHCKACLVVRREGKTLRRYCHLATGNYNHFTAGMYTDLGLFTANPAFCEDVANLFNKLTGFAEHGDWNRIVLSPYSLQEKLVELIQREVQIARRGGKARITCKMNSLVDPTLIKALYTASQAGVKIDLIIRGICCLRPGVPGLSDNIQVISVIGRFLEHSRIFYFGGKDPQLYLSSADWMQRNFFRRIEVMFPVEDPEIRERIMMEILPVLLADNVNAWNLRADGSWKRRSKPGSHSAIDCQQKFIEIEQEASTKLPRAI